MHESEFALGRQMLLRGKFTLGKICSVGKIYSGEFALGKNIALGRKVAMESYSEGGKFALGNLLNLLWGICSGELLWGGNCCSGELTLGMALLLWGHRQLLLGSNLWRKRCLKKETLDKKKDTSFLI